MRRAASRAPSRSRDAYAWQDTNLALFGSDLEKRIKAASAGHERAWDGVGLEPELRIWRIEQFRVREWPRRKYGSFHEGDSYVVLHAFRKHARSDALAYDVYIWIGESSTADEYGTAAYKMCELDHKLGDAAVHHREVMEHESRVFLDLFRESGVTYLAGGVESGFVNVAAALEDATPEPALYQVKGVRGALILRQLRDRRRDRLNSGDVFVLDTTHMLVQWNGRQANAFEKRRAQQLVAAIVASRGGSGRCRAVTLDEGVDDDAAASDAARAFWTALPGERRFLGVKLRSYDVRGELQGGDDARVKPFRKVLYRLSDARGSLAFARVARAARRTNQVPRRRLTSDDAFVLDDGFQVWCFVGARASASERGLAMQYAMRYIAEKQRPPFLPITMVFEGSEPAAFAEHFADVPASCLPWRA